MDINRLLKTICSRFENLPNGTISLEDYFDSADFDHHFGSGWSLNVREDNLQNLKMNNFIKMAHMLTIYKPILCGHLLEISIFLAMFI